MTLDNSTISKNIASGSGGGIYNIFGIDVFNSSIVFNGADADQSGGSAGGIYSNSHETVFNLRNTLVAGNYLAGSPVYDDCTGTPTRLGEICSGWWLTVR